MASRRFDDGAGTVHAYHRTWYDGVTHVMACEHHTGRWVRVRGQVRFLVATEAPVNCMMCISLERTS